MTVYYTILPYFTAQFQHFHSFSHYIMKKTTFILSLFILLFCLSSCLSDIRTQRLKQQTSTKTEQQKGQKLLAEAMEAHGGLEHWKAQKTVETILTDKWFGLFGKMLKPWKSNPQKLKHQILLDTDISRVEFLDGKLAGDIWGIQYWHTYTQKKGQQPIFKKDKNIYFVLPTVAYFFELPFRLREADIITYAGKTTLKGQNYELVYATWQEEKPNKQMDQYLVYINTDTKLIDWVEYTVRDKANFITGSVHYTDYRAVNDIQVSFTQNIYSGKPKKQKKLHQFRYESVVFGADIPEKTLIPAPEKRKGKF